MQLIKTSEIESQLDTIEKSLDVNRCNIYLFILGNQTKKALNTLPDYVSNIELLWTGWSGPQWMKFVFFFAAGYAGLYKFSSPSGLKELAMEASLGGLVEIIITKDPMDSQLKELITDNGVNPQFIKENILWGSDNMLIEMSRDTDEIIDSETAGFFSVQGQVTIQPAV